MSDWLHNLPVPWMALAIFSFVYLAAGVIFASVHVLAARERLRAFKDVSAGLLSPLGTLFALFVAFARMSLSGFGGVLAFARRGIVEQHRWISLGVLNVSYHLGLDGLSLRSLSHQSADIFIALVIGILGPGVEPPVSAAKGSGF